MNNTSKYLVIAFLSFCLMACQKDKSTVDIRSISEINIEFNEVKAPVLNIDKNETLTIDPVITQQESGKALSYEWQFDDKVISTEKKLTYVGSHLGTYLVRLKVSNKDGSTFKKFTLNVNSPYEEGLMVLGEAEDGEGTISFLRKYSEAEKAAGKVESFATNCFGLNNPGLTLGKGPSDVVKRASQIYIASKTDGKITLINNKTFEMEAVITAPEFPDFKPFKINVPDNKSTSSVVLSANGELYTLASKDHLILKNTALEGKGTNLALKTAFVGGMNFTDNYFWDIANSRLWNLWYINTNSKDELAGQELIQFFPTPGACYVLTRDKIDHSKLTKTVFGEYIQVFFEDPLDIKEKVTFTDAAPTLNENSVIEVSEKYKKLIYANGNKIYSWFYSGNSLSPTPYITIDIPGTITDLTIGPDGNELYVGVYSNAATKLKGSILVYNIDNGSLLHKYEGVADKPVKLFYKTRN